MGENIRKVIVSLGNMLSTLASGMVRIEEGLGTWES